MTYVVTEACINCKYTDCVEVCPVDCFFEGENMLVIDPQICIDCGVCVPECPVEAILPDTAPGAESWVDFNSRYARIWPNIRRATPPLLEAEYWAEQKDKLSLFSPLPPPLKKL